MGQYETSPGNVETERPSRHLFDFKYVIGRGGFGKVWKVSYKKTQHIYALKEMSKVKIMDRKSEKSIMSERNLLSRLNNPFIVNMICSFQDDDYLYLVMDLLTGGDLRYHLCFHKRFTEEQTKFFLACLILGLEYIHSNKVIHRDIKPENLVLDSQGYMRITDFGVAKNYHKNNSEETSGTPGYMAPEVLCAKNHTYVVDFFALGVIGYEFMLGERPYVGRSRKEVRNAVLAKQVEIKVNQIPQGWSYESADFVNKLIQRKPQLRLGANGIEEIKAHKWFHRFNWNELYYQKMKAPFIPKNKDNFDKKYCEAKDQITEETLERYRCFKRRSDYHNIFHGYTCNNISETSRLSNHTSLHAVNVYEPHTNSVRKTNTNESTINSTKNKDLNQIPVYNYNNDGNNNKPSKHKNADVSSKPKLKKTSSTGNMHINLFQNYSSRNNNNIASKLYHFNIANSPKDEYGRHNNYFNSLKQKKYKFNSGCFSPNDTTKFGNFNGSSSSSTHIKDLPKIDIPTPTQKMRRSASNFNMFSFKKNTPDFRQSHYIQPQCYHYRNNSNNGFYFDYNNILSTNKHYLSNNNSNSNNNTNVRNSQKKNKITIMGISNVSPHNNRNKFRKSASMGNVIAINSQ